MARSTGAVLTGVARTGAPGVVLAATSSTVPVGVDVSSHQHPNGAGIDWSQVAASGQKFGLVKAIELYTDTTTGKPVLYTNPYLRQDVSGARSAGLMAGAYIYAHPENSPLVQADDLAAAVGTGSSSILPVGSLPLELDLETTGGLTVPQLVAWTHAFMDRLTFDTGTVPMIYAGPNFWSTNLGGSTAFAAYPLWEAHYTTNSAPYSMGGWPSYSLWQYTSTGSVPGIPTAVDQDRAGTAPLSSLAKSGAVPYVTGPVTLTAGQALVSSNGMYRLVMQADGNLAEYETSTAGAVPGASVLLWASGTGGHPGAQAMLGADGNLSITTAGQRLWSSGTTGAGSGGVLSVASNGDVTLSDAAGRVIWHGGGVGTALLSAGSTLRSDQSVVAGNGQYRLTMQSDGNLVEYGNGRALWASNTDGSPGATATVQSDGNFVVYSPAGAPLWSSGTWRAGAGVEVVLHASGDLTLAAPAGQVAWRTATPGTDSLVAGAVLAAGQFLHSADGIYTLTMAADGTLVQAKAGVTRWTSGTGGHPGARLTLQSDGNLVIYDSAGVPLWATGTNGVGSNPGRDLMIMQSDGNAVLYEPSGPLWATGTVG